MAQPSVESSPQHAADGSWTTRWGLMLRMARQVEGLSLSELAARSGLSKGYLSKLESAHPSAANPSRATLAALARALPSTVPLIQHLAPTDGLPTPASLLGGEWRAMAGQHQPGAVAVTQTGVAGALVGGEQEQLPSSWTEWEILLTLVILEGGGLGPPTQATIERGCQAATQLDDLLTHLERDGLLRKLPPARVGEPARYTLQGTRLDYDLLQRPAHLFMQAAMSLLLGTGKDTSGRSTPSSGNPSPGRQRVR